MRILLDTHIFIWWDSEPEKLSARARSLCEDAENTLVLSVVSVWEIQIKQQLDKLTLRLPIAELIQRQESVNRLEILPVRLAHVLAVGILPPYHKDPFDRLLIAQANTEELGVLTADQLFQHYPVNLLDQE